MSQTYNLPDPSESFDFRKLLALTREELFHELLDTASVLANLSSRIGFLRAEEIRTPAGFAKQERLEIEGQRVAYDEKKWVLIRYLELWRDLENGTEGGRRG